MVKRELFKGTKPRPYIVPKIVNCENVLGDLIAKSYGRQVWEIAHVKGQKRWFRALRMRKKIFILLEGRKEEEWWTITFSHGFDKNAKIHIIREVMRKNKTFVPVFKRRLVKRDIDVLAMIGKAWKLKCEGKIYRGHFAKHVARIMKVRERKRKRAADRFQANPQAVRLQYET
jgi:hypothetical protein